MKKVHRVVKFNQNAKLNMLIWNLLAAGMKKTQILINKPVYLGLSILDMSQTVMYEFWYDYVKQKKIVKIQNFVIWMQKQKIFKKIFQKMLTQDLTLEILN